MNLPRRVVSLVPSTTETLFALDLADRVVGVTDFCTRPAEMPAHVRRIGGTKTPDLTAIRELAPDLILANQEENRREDIAALRQWVAVDLSFPRSVPEAVADLRRLGVRLGVADSAERLAGRIEAGADRVRRLARPFRFAYLIWRRPWMAAGRDTYIDAFLGLGGGRNIFPARDGRYPQLALKALAERHPDVVFLPDEPYPFEAKHIDEIAAALGPEWSARCRLISGDNYCWHGVRLIEGLDDYARWLALAPMPV